MSRVTYHLPCPSTLGGEGGDGEVGGGEGGGGEGGDALPLLHHLPHLGMWTKLRPGAAPPHLH